MTTVNYNSSKAYTGAYQKPLADLDLIGPNGRASVSAVLVDTGADFLQLPERLAVTVGLLPSSAATIVSVSVKTAGGSLNMKRLAGVSVEVEGVPITTDLLCHPSGTSRALLGRGALRALTNVGFNVTHWLW